MAEALKVGVVIPDADFSAAYKFLAGKWLTMGADALPVPGKVASDGISALHRLVFGGIPVRGVLSIHSTSINIETDPDWMERLLIRGDINLRFSIPIDAIVGVTGPKSLVLGLLSATLPARRITIKTADASFFITAELKGPALTRRLQAICAAGRP